MLDLNLCFFSSCAILAKLKQGGRKMPFKKDEMLSEYVEYMLRIGMKVVEIQDVFPNFNSQNIHELGKKIGISTRMSIDNTLVANRNKEIIKRFLQRFIEEYDGKRDVSKAKILLKNIDYLAPTPNGRQRVKEKRKKDSKEEQVNEER